MFVTVGLKNFSKLGKFEIREVRFYHARKVKTVYGVTEIVYIDEKKGLTNERYNNKNIAYITSCTDTIGMRNLIKEDKK